MPKIEIELTDEELLKLCEIAADRGEKPENWLQEEVVELINFCRSEIDMASAHPSDLYIPKPPDGWEADAVDVELEWLRK